MQSERPSPKGTILPTTCKVGDFFMLINRSTSKSTLHICFADNTWEAFAGNDVTLTPTVSIG